MLDIRVIREEPDRVRATLKRRGLDPARIDEILAVDADRRALQASVDSLRAELNSKGKEIGAASGESRKALLDRVKGLSDKQDEARRQLLEFEQRQRTLLLEIPNIPHDSVPDGETDDDNLELRRWGEPQVFGFEPKDHLDIGEALGVIDMERASRASGTRFGYLKRGAALLWLALERFAIDRLAQEGFTPVVPPVLVRREAMEGTGFLPTDEQQIYALPEDGLYLVGTSEVPLAALHMGEFLDAGALPLRYCATSSCFRREAGAHGRDTRGIFRTHQFEKVEMFVFTRAGESWDEHARLVGIQESIAQALGLPYRVVDVCAGELGASAARKVDLEAWFPGQNRYREITSCSNTTDYQARRLQTRIRTERGPQFVHTSNGTAVTSSRTIAALLENHQRADGSVGIPEALRPYTGFDAIER